MILTDTPNAKRTFERPPHQMPNLRNTLLEHQIPNLRARQTTPNNKNIRPLPRRNLSL
jgi:hypothetical protein